jgi:hypothetical protein
MLENWTKQHLSRNTKKHVFLGILFSFYLFLNILYREIVFLGIPEIENPKRNSDLIQIGSLASCFKFSKLAQK